MRHFNIRHQAMILLLLFMISSWSCQDATTTTSPYTDSSIPALLTRNEKIRMGKEWDDVQSNYQKLKMAIEKNDADQESKIRLAQLFIREARITGEHGHYYPAALTITERILQNKGTDPSMTFLALVTKAGIQLSHHEFDKALETGKLALTYNQSNAQLYGVLTDAYVELGQYENAIEMSDIMIKIKPDLRAYARISYIREIHGQVDEAIDAMKMAVEAGVPGYEDTAWAMQTLGNMYKMYGQPEKAKQVYQEILVSRPDYPFAVAALGELQMEAQDYDKAASTTQQAIDIIPEVGFYTQIAEIYKAQRKTDKFDQIIPEILVMLKDDVDSGHNMNL
ncbi:MAG: hypothetical protein WBO36_08385, partial [Saprospiraceae bacterium]